MMSAPLRDPLVVSAALGCGLMAGLFFAFSVCVMRALARLPAPEAVRAMQTVNVVILNRWFLTVFFGTALVCTLALGVAVRGGPGSWASWGSWAVTGGALYLAGTLGVTVACNVPLNEALAALDANSPACEAVWTQYLARWTAWNHVRTVAASAATLAFAVSALLSRR